MKYLILLIPILMSAKGCDAIKLGDEVAVVYPSHNLARKRSVISTCPIQVSSATDMSMSDLPDGGCWIPAEQCGEYTKKYESKCN